MHITWLSSVMLWYGRCLDKKPYAQQTNTQFVKSECKKMREKKIPHSKDGVCTLRKCHTWWLPSTAIHLSKHIVKKYDDDGACNANP